MSKTIGCFQLKVYAILLLLASIGLIFVFIGSRTFSPLDEPALVFDSAKYSIPLGLLISFCSYLFVSKPLFLNKYYWVTPLAIVTTTFINGAAVAYHFNARADSTIGVQKQLNILDKRALNARGKKTYYVVVESWRPDRKEERIKVQRDEYFSLNLPAEVRLTLKTGALNHPWIERYSLHQR